MTIIELSLSGLAYGGEAFGRDHDGRMIFVPFALPDELVRVEIVEEHKRWARTHLLEVLEPSTQASIDVVDDLTHRVAPLPGRLCSDRLFQLPVRTWSRPVTAISEVVAQEVEPIA